MPIYMYVCMYVYLYKIGPNWTLKWRFHDAFGAEFAKVVFPGKGVLRQGPTLEFQVRSTLYRTAAHPQVAFGKGNGYVFQVS